MDSITSPNNVAAWALKPKQRPLTVSSARYTPPKKGEVAIKVSNVAINPIDWKLQDIDAFNLKYPVVFGLDIAGEVVEVGEDVTELKAGTRVIALGNGYSRGAAYGAFQKYAVIPAVAISELPPAISEQDGVVLPLGITTASAGLYQKDFLNLPYPSPSKAAEDLGRTVVVWGGSSSVGSSCIQLAVASGAEVFTTSSAGNFSYCEGLGAAKCFDYHDSDIEDQIVDALKGKTCAGAFHAAGGDLAVEACARIVDRVEGKAIVATVARVPDNGIPGSVRAKMVASTTIFKTEVGRHIWREFIPKALREGTIIPKPDAVIAGEGLNSVQHGLDKQKAGVSAAKVVVTKIQDGSGRQYV
ncbi:GroES-like protein [Polychaeton citri CBS 116435]|uniref:GroES-like protein n=1 Tax=Polychaeton citri CBS 116435 TaxID=1314669 RepID=A0A9P4UIT8_9PEZI|nr:GroES-like protein [Polychaeton citri CBS 116435]